MVKKGQQVIDTRLDPRMAGIERGTVSDVREINGHPMVFVEWEIQQDTEVLSVDELVWNEGLKVYVISRYPQQNELIVDPSHPDRIGRVYATPLDDTQGVHVVWQPNLVALTAEIERLDAIAQAYEEEHGKEMPYDNIPTVSSSDLLWNARWSYWVFA